MTTNSPFEISPQSLIERVLSEYPAARTSEFTNHPLASVLRQDLVNAINRVLPVKNYAVKGSAGQGNWAETPWLAVFDPFVTTTAQEGYYVVYLFRGDGESVFLSLNQATTEVKRLVQRRYLDVLRHTAGIYRDLLPDGAGTTASGPISLGGSRALSRGYEAGNIASIEYRRGSVPGDDQLQADLALFLSLYRDLTTARDALADATQAAPEELTFESGVEGDKFRWHKRVERRSSLANAAKKIHGTTCHVCGFSFESTYGALGAGYIEAHHLVPVAELAERPRSVSPQTDFAVVCANCHRMLHRGEGRSMTVDGLRALIAKRADSSATT